MGHCGNSHFTHKNIMLIGEYTHTIDEKNRLSMPVKFRKEMGKSVVVAPWLDNCLAIFTMKEWEKISSKLSESSMLQVDNRSFSKRITNAFCSGVSGPLVNSWTLVKA